MILEGVRLYELKKDPCDFKGMRLYDVKRGPHDFKGDKFI